MAKREQQSLIDLCAKVLLVHRGQKFDARQLADRVLAENPQHFARKRAAYEARYPGRSVAYQIEREIYSRRSLLLKQFSEIRIDASDKIRFVAPPLVPSWVGSPTKNQKTSERVKAPPLEPAEDEAVYERDLYPAVQAYLWDSEQIFSKRIRESTSSNKRGKNGNKWLHPDIVGMHVPGVSWDSLVRDCSDDIPARKAKLISIEVKLRVTSANIRQYFFQTVSNSLWANRAYLAAAEVTGEDTRAELTTLCALHGVGYMLVDPEAPTESSIIIPAREREDVDWASVNRIVEENADFRKYLKAVSNYLQTRSVEESLWDSVQS